METRKHRELKDEEIEKLFKTYRAWKKNQQYQDIDGFAKSASIEEIRSHDYVLTPGRYVGIEDEIDDGISFDEKMQKLTFELAEQFKKSESLEENIKENLKDIGYEF